MYAAISIEGNCLELGSKFALKTYRSTNAFVVKVKDLSCLQEIIDDIVNAWLNSIDDSIERKESVYQIVEDRRRTFHLTPEQTLRLELVILRKLMG